ncbi:hypothetical protein LXL04_032263 [Taraxacum kok-saghyz]
MAEAVMSFKIITPHIHHKPSLQTTRFDLNPLSKSVISPILPSIFLSSKFQGQHSSMAHSFGEDSKRSRLKALPDLTLMAVLVEHMEGQRDLITHKSIWHLNDQTIKNVYTLYIMFTVWGCCFFGAMKSIEIIEKSEKNKRKGEEVNRRKKRGGRKGEEEEEEEEEDGRKKKVCGGRGTHEVWLGRIRIPSIFWWNPITSI